MNMAPVPTVTATVAAVVAAWATHRFGRAQGRLDRAHARLEEAAGALSEPLREPRRLVRYGWVELREREVPDAFAAWFDVLEQRTRLPKSWERVGHSVRTAGGEVFGAPVFVDRRPDVATVPLGEPDSVWQGFAEKYFTYCLDALARWADDDPRAPESLLDYDTWLKSTGRREPFDSGQTA